MSAGSLVESTLAVLRSALRIAAPDAHLVEPRILRRVIRLDRRLAGLGIAIPHAHCYTIETARLLAYVEWDELELAPTTDLPWKVILLAKPGLESLREIEPQERWLAEYSRILFHGRLHMELDRFLPPLEATDRHITQRMEQIGQQEFSEIRTVLSRENLLFPEADDREVYIEFVASFWEMHYYAPADRQWRFPCVRHWTRLEELLSQDVAHAQLWQSCQLDTSPLAETAVATAADEIVHSAPVSKSGIRARTKQHISRAVRAVSRGNGIRAAILRARLAEEANSGEEAQAAVDELQSVVRRLQPILGLSQDDVQEWTNVFQPLLIPATKEFWTVEARLLYDLQKVCVEYERGVFQVNLIDWCRSLGRSPLRIPLPLLREVLITKHLRSALRRVPGTRIAAEQRAKLVTVLSQATQLAETRARDRIRPLIVDVFDRVGLVPANVPERVSRQNVVEELLDHIVEQGVANLGHLRDSLSKNDIKLPDLAGARELLGGDLLLRVDREMGRTLGGIYRPGAIYLRSTQRLSSLAFGTRTGRWLTQYLVIPFGGAYVVLAFLRHLIDIAMGRPGHSKEASHADSVVDIPYLAAVLVLGTSLLLLMHSTRFRLWWRDLTVGIWHAIRILLVDVPAVILRSPIVRDILRSPTYAAFRSYLLIPALVTLFAYGIGLIGPLRTSSSTLSRHFLLEIFLATALFLNSRVGRYLEELVGDLLIRLWHDLRIRVFAAVYDWVMDTFHRLFVGLERVVYSVDEFLRFRTGDSRFVGGIKLLAGTVWLFIAYVVVFAFTLLIEPQINPIKHFPVVTVSHKVLIPIGYDVVKVISPYVGTARANALVWSTIFLIPGVIGFLVWELKENWRLYAANRPHLLSSVPVGHHGETMLHFLRTGFHSGTLPRLFHQLRRALAQSHLTADFRTFQRKESELHRTKEVVHRFFERKLLWLWQESKLIPGTYQIQESHLATNRIEVSIAEVPSAAPPLRLRWDEYDGHLTGTAEPNSWVDRLTPSQQQAVAMSVAGIFRRGAVELTKAPWPLRPVEAIGWHDWVQFWSSASSNPLPQRDENAFPLPPRSQTTSSTTTS